MREQSRSLLRHMPSPIAATSSLLAIGSSLGSCPDIITLDDRSDENIDAKARDVRSSPLVNKVVVQKDIADVMKGVLDDAMGMLYAFFFINLLIAVVVAASAVIISTMERDVEFATMDTLGISRWKVAK